MEIASYVFEKVVDYLPVFMLSRMYKEKNVAQQIEIRVKGENPIYLTLGAEVPCVDLSFEITNLSHLNLVLDRLLIDFWFGQPTFQGALLKRYIIPKRKTVEIYYRYNFMASQIKQIEEFSNNAMAHGRIEIYLTAYFESKVGMIEVQKSIERSKI